MAEEAVLDDLVDPARLFLEYLPQEGQHLGQFLLLGDMFQRIQQYLKHRY